MVSLAKMQTYTHNKVISYITRLPQSFYFGANPAKLEHELTPAHARRYLFVLIMINETDKSAFSDVEEKSSQFEQSYCASSVS